MVGRHLYLPEVQGGEIVSEMKIKALAPWYGSKRGLLADLYPGWTKIAQALLIAAGDNPDLPASEFPRTFDVDGWDVTITPNDEPGEYDVDWVAARAGAVR